MEVARKSHSRHVGTGTFPVSSACHSVLAALLSWLLRLGLLQARARANLLQGKQTNDFKVRKEDGAEVDMSDGVFDILGYLPRAVFKEQ